MVKYVGSGARGFLVSGPDGRTAGGVACGHGGAVMAGGRASGMLASNAQVKDGALVPTTQRSADESAFGRRF
ncbi:hypothetical protein [Raineyella fluvialis]|uniref:Uncharacterized protein n=1 Tax=Raineyella fluvialis TaxID=2662261 RepID=A0A5Q2FH97_9ACTN|nr:hypothetical protein [Raineyella fluvialis]QGF23696.1 hypothetical protein Rai3103_08440 [Raineyella fluvialis]